MEGVTPELYGTPWFFTYFASKCDKIELVLKFWEVLITQVSLDKMSSKFIFAFSTAMITINRKLILCSDNSELPVKMSRLCLTSTNQLNRLLEGAKMIVSNTPVSFWESDEINLLFGEKSSEFFKSLTKDQKK